LKYHPNIKNSSQKYTFILKATNTEPVRTIIAVEVRIGRVEVQVTRITPIRRATPIVAVAANIVERAIGSITVARNWPF
jgi:arginine/ornithine N-succinyltransferase beta subunit